MHSSPCKTNISRWSVNMKGHSYLRCCSFMYLMSNGLRVHCDLLLMALKCSQEGHFFVNLPKNKIPFLKFRYLWQNILLMSNNVWAKTWTFFNLTHGKRLQEIKNYISYKNKITRIQLKVILKKIVRQNSRNIKLN